MNLSSTPLIYTQASLQSKTTCFTSEYNTYQAVMVISFMYCVGHFITGRCYSQSGPVTDHFVKFLSTLRSLTNTMKIYRHITEGGREPSLTVCVCVCEQW